MQFRERKLLEDINDDVVIELDVDKKQFRFWNGKKYIYIPKDSDWHAKLRDEYRTQKKIEQRKKDDPNFDLDAYKKADDERIKLDSQGDAILKQAEEKQRKRQEDDNYYKGGDDRKTYTKIKPELNPDFDILTQQIMTDFEKNVLVPYTTYEFQATTEVARDPMDIDDDFYDDVSTRDVMPKTIMEVDERTPFVLLYFDCSGSWNTPAKTLAREKLGSYFESLRDKGLITYKERSFAEKVGDKDTDVGGATFLKPVVEDIQSLTNGKLSNVIVVTDSDFDSDHYGNTSRAPYVTVDGMVWYIFVNSFSDELPKHVKSDKDGWSKAFYFTSEDRLGD